MRVGFYHGYELGGSGSNEYTRYLSRELARAGHSVQVLCREPEPESIEHLTAAWDWTDPTHPQCLFERSGEGVCILHRLPHASVRPVFLTDKQRDGRVKTFPALEDSELEEYHRVCVASVRAVLERFPVDILHANHLVWQPSVAAESGVPFIVYPHGSAIEYTVRADSRYHRAAQEALRAARGLISGSEEILDRICRLFPEDRASLLSKSTIVGVGVDTTLFTPVAREGRREALTPLRGPRKGKPSRLTQRLGEQLDLGHIEAIVTERDAYDHAQPDADLEEKLAAVDWSAGKVLLFVGALTAGKGLQALLAALPAVLDRHPSMELLVVGSGAYREVLEALVHALATGNQALFDHLCAHGFDLDRSELSGPWEDVGGPVPKCPEIARRVHFLGRLNHDLLQHLFPCADLAVFPSILPEAYPLVLMESLANGVLPLVSDMSGFADGLRGLVPLLGSELVDRMRLPVEPKERVPGIAARITALLDDPDRSRNSDALRAIAVEHFDWSVRAQEMAEAYARFV